MDFNELCQKVLDLDPKVRFAGVANIKGILIAGGQKENIEKLLADDQVSMSIHYAFQKRELYTALAYKIGPELSSITEFEKVTMITIPINSQELFLISTDPRADYLKIIDFLIAKLNS